MKIILCFFCSTNTITFITINAKLLKLIIFEYNVEPLGIIVKVSWVKAKLNKRFSQNGLGARDSCLVACLLQNLTKLLL